MVSTLRAFVFFSPSSFSSIDRSVAREAEEEEEEKEEEEKEEEEKEEDFLASFFSIFFLLLKMLMTSKNVSTGEFVSELKYVSTFLTDKTREGRTCSREYLSTPRSRRRLSS